MKKYNDKTGSMTGAPTMAQLKQMSVNDNTKRVKQMERMKTMPISNPSTSIKNSTPSIKPSVAKKMSLSKLESKLHENKESKSKEKSEGKNDKELK